MFASSRRRVLKLNLFKEIAKVYMFASSRRRVLKLTKLQGADYVKRSPPHGGVYWNKSNSWQKKRFCVRLLTEACIETNLIAKSSINILEFASSRRRVLKRRIWNGTSFESESSPPHGGVYWNIYIIVYCVYCKNVRLLTEACIETLFCLYLVPCIEHSSPPHGGVYWNVFMIFSKISNIKFASSRRRVLKLKFLQIMSFQYGVRLLTEACIETYYHVYY